MRSVGERCPTLNATDSLRTFVNGSYGKGIQAGPCAQPEPSKTPLTRLEEAFLRLCRLAGLAEFERVITSEALCDICRRLAKDLPDRYRSEPAPGQKRARPDFRAIAELVLTGGIDEPVQNAIIERCKRQLS